MTEIGDTTQSPKMARIQVFLTSRRGVLRDYFTAISGSAGRLVFSLAYFVALANTLSIADFGLFATASAAGVMLSRILGFGFISALYRVATIRPRLIGTFTGGFILLSARCSYELVEKTVRANCPMLVTISAPTTLAVERATRAGLTLVTLARADAALVVSGLENIG